jgi:hypothetical protein
MKPFTVVIISLTIFLKIILFSVVKINSILNILVNDTELHENAILLLSFTDAIGIFILIVDGEK